MSGKVLAEEIRCSGDPLVPLAELPTDEVAVFHERPNRFLGLARLEDDPHGPLLPVHVHDPGRLREILYPGNRILLRRAAAQRRKTAWDVVAGRVGPHWVLVHAGFHRKLAERIILDPSISPFGAVSSLRAEVPRDDSRLDFLVTLDGGATVWIEVKGCTLVVDGVALFPDAPTARGRKHLRALTSAVAQRERAALVVLVLRPDARCFAPHEATDPAYASAFHDAVSNGVEVHPLLLSYQDGVVSYLRPVPLCDSPHPPRP